MTSALVTGGTGFVGANLVAGLNAMGIEPLVLHRSTSPLAALDGLAFRSAVGDVLDSVEALVHLLSGLDWVFHVAAVSDYWRSGKDRLFAVNVEGTRRVARAARVAGAKRLVFTSSLAAMGVQPPGALLDESSRYNLQPKAFPYGYSKHLAEEVILEEVSRGLQAVIVNPSIVIGPRDLNKVSGSLILEAARGRLRLSPPGGANFIDVDAVAQGHIAAAEYGRVGERYLLGGVNMTHREAAAIICRIVGEKPPRLQLPKWIMPGIAVGVSLARGLFGNRIPLDANQVRISGHYIYADSKKAEIELGLPQTSFESAVQKCYLWYLDKGYL